MSDTGYTRDNLAWRVGELERKVASLEQGQPQVVAYQVAQLAKGVEALEREVKDDMAGIRRQIIAGDEAQAKQIRDFRRIFIGVFSALGTGIGIAIVALIVTGPA